MSSPLLFLIDIFLYFKLIETIKTECKYKEEIIIQLEIHMIIITSMPQKNDSQIIFHFGTPQHSNT